MKKTIIALAVLLLVLSACQFPFQKKEQLDIPEVKRGTYGIVLGSLPNAPPPEVFEDSLFSILIEVSNKGASDVFNGIAVLSLEEQYFSIPRQQAVSRFDVAGKSIFNPEGQIKRISYSVQSAKLMPQQQSYDAEFIFSVCYPYTTDAVLQTCIDTDIFNMNPNKVCTPRPSSFGGGQGAPVAITRIEPRMTPHENPDMIKPEFIISVSDRGNGLLIAKESTLDFCTGSSVGREETGVVDFEVYLSDTPLECNQGNNRIRLRDYESQIVCSLPQGIPVKMGTYTAPLTVKLHYGYVNNLLMPVTITKPSR